jgi:glycosyltransferase involved in cell wall biosynthesis
MKVLIYDWNMPYYIKDSRFPVGGATVELYAWSDGFITNGVETGILTWAGANDYIGQNSRFNIIEGYYKDKGLRGVRYFLYRLPKLFNTLRNYKPNFLFQECFSDIVLPLVLFSKILGIKFIHRIASDRDVDLRTNRKFSKWRIYSYKLGLFFTDFIVCQNQYQYKILKSKYPNKKIIIKYNPIVSKFNFPIKAKDERSYIAWMGNHRREKNLKALLDVAKALPQFQFKVTGTTLNTVDDFTLDAIKGLKECNNVDFVGYIKNDEVLDFVSKAYLLLNTSFYEGFSNTYLEAWAAGTPIITTVNANPDNICEKYVLGKVASNYLEIPNLINSLISDDSYNEIAKNCRNYVINNHNPKQIAMDLINFMYYDK